MKYSFANDLKRGMCRKGVLDALTTAMPVQTCGYGLDGVL